MTRGRVPQWTWAAIPIGLCLALVVHLCLFLARFVLPIPQSDHWGILGDLLTSLERGDALWPTLWAQSNEHRYVIGRLADLATVKLFRGDLRAEVYAAVAFAAATAGIAGYSAWRKFRESNLDVGLWTLPLMMGMAVAPAQMEVWGSPVSFALLVENLAVVLGLLMLGASEWTWWRFCLAAVCGLVATGCFANGLLFWPAALVPLAARADRRRIWAVAGWIALSVAVWVAYFTGFHKNPGHPSVLAWKADILGFVQFAAGVLGNPIGAAIRPQSPLAPVVIPVLGLLGLALLGFATVRLWRRGLLRSDAGSWLGLAAYGLLTVAVIAVSRQGFGFVVALSSRYTTLVWPLWAAILVLLLASFAAPRNVRGRRAAGRAPLSRVAGRGIVALFLVVGLASTNSQVQRWTPIMRDRAAAIRELPDLCLGNGELASKLGPLELIGRYLPLFSRYGLARLPVLRSDIGPVQSGPEVSGAVESVRLESHAAVPTGGRCLRVAGWAGLEKGPLPAEEVFLVSRGAVLKAAWVGNLRSHSGQDYDADPHPSVGWVLYVDTKRLSREDRSFDVYAVFPSRTKVVRIGGFSI